MKILRTTIMLASICFSHKVNAIINGIYFKGVTSQFKEECIQYSPLVGRLALDTGLTL
jgi:hypothetical protein